MQNNRSSSVTQYALEIVASARPVVDAVQRKDRDLGSQLRRALSSVVLNLSEGFGSVGGNTKLRFHTAYGSLCEARTAIEIAVAWGYVSQTAAKTTLEGIERLGGHLFGLLPIARCLQLHVDSRQPKAESRLLAADCWQPKAGSRKPAAESRQPKADTD